MGGFTVLRFASGSMRMAGMAAVSGLWFCGCASHDPAGSTKSNTHQQWKIGDFVVSFSAGPRIDGNGHPQSYSFYQVSRKFDAYPGINNIGIQSAMDVRHFQQESDSPPGQWIQLFKSPSGKTLLIVEDVPNDCGPCMNHIVVTSKGDELESIYLDLPSRLRRNSKGEVVEQVFGMRPVVTRIDDARIFYHYDDGTKVEEDLRKREKAEQKPNFPG